MSPAMKTGFVRVGVLLSILWILVVAGIAFHEGHDESKLCSVSDMTVAQSCHQFFWVWQRPEDAQNPQASSDQDQKDQGIHIHIGKLNLDVARGKPLEHHINVEHLIIGLFGPLIVLWGIGFGIFWCVAGFAKPK
jgi:hypothetical protein